MQPTPEQLDLPRHIHASIWTEENGMPKDWVVVLGSLATLTAMYWIGYLCIDVIHLFSLTPWQSEKSHIDGCAYLRADMCWPFRRSYCPGD